MSNKMLLVFGLLLVVVAAGIVFWQQTEQNAGKSVNDLKPDVSVQPGQVAGEDSAESTGKNPVAEITVKGFGIIQAELYQKDAPKTVANFIGLAEKGYFDGVSFHRVAKDFVIQGGDPTGTGSGGSSIYGGEFADELNPQTDSYQAGYKQGVLAMANRGRNTNTSQFFIMLKDNNTLPKDYTIFGKVIAGMEVVEKIGRVEVNPGVFGPADGQPKQPVIMESVKILK